MKNPIARTVTLMCVGFLLAGSASAAENLRFTPADTTVSPEANLRFAPADTVLEKGATSRLSIMCDEALDLRTIEVFVEFNPLVVGSVGGGPGTLFTDSGFMLFKGYELTEPNVWHGYCVILGSGDFITGPGELFYWEFEALADGVSPVITVMVDLVAPDATVLPDVTLPATTIIVGDGVTPAPDIPSSGQGLRCYPNPFNPRTEIRFDLPGPQTVELTVFDLTGRRVALLHSGPAPQGVFARSWDGCDAQGRPQPGGVYLFQLRTPTFRSLAKGVLLK